MNFTVLKKVIVLFCITSILLFSGCTGKSDITEGEKLSVVCTSFPQYDWVRNIVGEVSDVEISLIIDNGTESHSYQATADDIIKIKNSDIFIFNGGKSDSSFDKIAEQNRHEGWISINMMNSIPEKLLYEDIFESESHNHHESTYDEHIWLSLNNSIELCHIITDELSKADPENSNIYKTNCENYTTVLENLNLRYKELVSGSAKKEIILADRHPFKYLMNDYNLKCYAAFPGCSSDTEASFETVITLAKKIDELGITKIAVTENSNSSIAESVISASAAESIDIITMNSIQSVSQKDIDSGLTYISAMESNLEALTKLLNSDQKS